MDKDLVSALIDLLLQASALIVAVTAWFKNKNLSSSNENLRLQLENLKHRIDGEYKSDIAIMKQKLDNDYNAITSLKAKTESQGTHLATLTQRVDVVEKIAEKVDRLTEIVISVKTLVERNQK